MSNTMPEGGGIQEGGKWYTVAQWQAKNGSTQTGTSTVPGNGSQLSALGIAHSVLDPLGLGQLADWYVGTYQQTGSWDYGNLELPNQPAFQQRFPAYKTLADRGDAITAADYVNYEKTVAQLGQQYGVPEGFFNADRIANALTNNQSTSEIQQDLSRAAQVVADPTTQAWMGANEAQGGLGGHILTPGEIYAAAVDPTVGEQAAADRFTQAQIGGAAAQSGFSINAQTAQQAQRAGVTGAQAQTAFQKLATEQPLLQALPGDNGSQNISTQTAASAALGTDPLAQAKLQQVADQRVADFRNGTNYVAGQGGNNGLGTATAS